MMRRVQFHALTIMVGLSLAGTLGAEEQEAGESQLLSQVRQLIFEGKRSGEGYFSADGNLVIFQSEREPGNPFYQMYVLDLQDGDSWRVSPGVGKTSCGWIHPDGDRVLFASTHEDPDAQSKQRDELAKRAAGTASRYSWSFDEHYDIYAGDLHGRGLRNLTVTPGYDAEGSWSPDGDLIAFASNRHAYQSGLSPEEADLFEHDKSYFMDIYLMDGEGGNVRRLTKTSGYDGGPFFSPDGRRIVWRRFSTNGATAEIWTMALDGTDQRQLTDDGVMSWAPYFHPSGEYIIYASNAQGMANFELYMVDAAGRSEPVRVTWTPGFDGLPVFSPDGKRLAWASKRTPDSSAQIFLADWDHARALELLEDTRAAESAPALPDLTQTKEGITAEDLRTHVDYLASPALGGRLTGSSGARLATTYAAKVFDALDLEPAGDDGGFFQSYRFTAGVSLDKGNRLFAERDQGPRMSWKADADWRPLGFSGNGDVPPTPVVMAGYGIVASAEAGQNAYDSYAGLDVSGKWVMVFRYLPEDVPAQERQRLARHLELRQKVMLARERGARGVLIVSGPNAGVEEALVPLRFDAATAGTSIPVISITDQLAEALLEGTGRSLEAMQDRLDGGDTVPGFELSGVRLGAGVRIRQEERESRNVLARLQAGDDPSLETVVIGAHVDHIGDGVGFGSLAGGEEQGLVHPGADDNASGVAGLLEIAQYLRGKQQRGRLGVKRDILFAVWTGEEMGLLGSGHFVRQRAGALKGGEGLWPGIAAYLNMDMIGRLDQAVYLQGVGSSPVWPGEIERRNAPVGLAVVTRNDSYLPTDATSFYLGGVPILSAFTGVHSDYNTPRDTPDTLSYQGMADIARLMALIGRGVAAAEAPPAHVAMDKPQGGASRRNLRAYLGTIPEYGDSSATGVRLNGVAGGGPAEQGGLRRGDLIVELAGRPVENVYDYTYALNALKIGEPVRIAVERDGERQTFTVVPGSRE